MPQSVVDRAIERDPVSADAEFGGNFRRDIEAFVSIEVVNGCVSHGIYERAPLAGTLYYGFVDPSGGSADAMTLAIGHIDHVKKTVVVDCLRETTPPFSPESVVADFARTLKTYRVFRVIGDKYAGAWPAELFGRHNITFEQSAAAKSDLYRDLLPLLNSGRLSLLDNPKLISQVCGLERRTARGRNSIDHAPGGHDDLANVVAGLSAAINRFPGYDPTFAGWNDDDVADYSSAKSSSTYAIQQLRAHIMSGAFLGGGSRWR